jgi:orotidine-5'-phosphate decarboxylase
MPRDTAKQRIVFPLDFPSADQACRFVDRLSGRVGLFKVGLELFISAGATVIDRIHRSGQAGIFLDLKLHDIPVTVERAMDRIADLGVGLATVHCGENPAMLAAAMAGSRGRVKVLGVTVLTSVAAEHLRPAGLGPPWVHDLPELVAKRASMARAAGLSGVVCSGLEAGLIKSRFGADFLAVTPGIRPMGEGAAGRDDQERIVTPAGAIQNGADYLVIGRPIRDAADPCQAADRIAAEIRTALAAG